MTDIVIKEAPTSNASDTPMKVVPRAILGVYPPRPSCEACSSVARKAYGPHVRSLVDSALIMRSSTGSICVVVKCHGKSDTLDLGPDADELTINGARAFKETR